MENYPIAVLGESERICRQMSLVCLLHLDRRTLDLEVVMTYLSEITEMALETQNVGLL